MIKSEKGRRPRVTTLGQIIVKATEFFNGDRERAIIWYQTPNSAFEGLSPYQYAIKGKSREVIKLLNKLI